MTPMTSTMRSRDARELTQRQQSPETASALDGQATLLFLGVPARIASTGAAWSLLGWYGDEGKYPQRRTRNACGRIAGDRRRQVLSTRVGRSRGRSGSSRSCRAEQGLRLVAQFELLNART